MEAMLGISLYSYLYLKLTKMLCLSYCLLCFLFKKIGEQEGKQVLPGSEGVGQGAGVAQTMYMNKCKSNKKKRR
jgi:hypothetical protein